MLLGWIRIFDLASFRGDDVDGVRTGSASGGGDDDGVMTGSASGGEGEASLCAEDRKPLHWKQKHARQNA